MHERQRTRLCEDFSRSLPFTDFQLLSEVVTVHFINHQCRVNQKQCMWSQHRENSWTLQIDGSARKHFRTQDFSSSLAFSQHTENQRHELQPVDIRFFDEREETYKTIRRFDPLVSDLVESLLNLHRLENSKATANPGRRSTVMELATAIPLDGHDYSNFGTAFGEPIFMATWCPDMQFAIQQLSPQVLNPTTTRKRAVKQLIRYLIDTHNIWLRLEPHSTGQKGLLELVGRSDSDWFGDSATRQSVTGYHCSLQCTRSDDVQAKSETNIQQSVSVRAKQSSTQPVHAQENFWLLQSTLKNFTTTFQFVSRRIQIRHVTSTAKRTRRTQVH